MGKRAIVSAPLVLLLRLGRKLWVRVSLMAALAVLASAAALVIEDILPQSLRSRFGSEAVMPILTILASGMLAVSTFSLNVMVAAHRAAAAQATPRAHRILLADTTTQTVLATFIGAFVYALSMIILLQAGLHVEGSAVTVMAVTVLVVVLVILAMLRWIDHLSNLGSMDATMRATEAEARTSLMQTRYAPALGALPLTKDVIIPQDALTIEAPKSGYVQVIDLAALTQALPDHAAHVWLTVPPGKFVLKGQRVGHASRVVGPVMAQIQNALTIGDDRTFEQDATYGLLVLSEIAARALSPGINDPGTAIEVIARQEKLLWEWAHTPFEQSAPDYPQIFLPELQARSLIKSAFASTARDGASMVEVVHRLLNALDALQTTPDDGLTDAAKDMTVFAKAHADKALVLEQDRKSPV